MRTFKISVNSESATESLTLIPCKNVQAVTLDWMLIKKNAHVGMRTVREGFPDQS